MEGFTDFSKKKFVAQETIDHISWPCNFLGKYSIAPPINFSFLFKAVLKQYFRIVLTVIFKFQITKEVKIHNNIHKKNSNKFAKKTIFFCHINILLQQ